MKYFIILTIFTFSVSFAQVDRTKIPQPGPAPEIKIGTPASFTLSNGLKVFVVENNKLPRVTFSLVIERDPVYEGEYSGYVSAAGQLLRSGTANRTKDQLDKEIDFLGATINTSSTGISGSSLSKHTEKMLELFSDILLNPLFPESETEKIKLRMKSDLASSMDDPSFLASRVSGVLRFGKDHPYGEISTPETIDKITAEKCREYYLTYFRPNTSYLAVVGDITKDKAEELVKKYFGSWQRGEVPEHKYNSPEKPEKRIVAIVDNPGAVQSVINVTYPVELKVGAPDALSANAMNTLLGGGVFRLFMNLREKHAYTYGAYSTLDDDELIGYFSASASVRNAVTDSAVNEILYEMNRLREEKVTSEELQEVKNYITGNFAMSLENPATVARFAINIERYKLPSDYYSSYLKRLEAVTPEDIHSAAVKYLQPDNSYVVVVGNENEIKNNLSRIGEVKEFTTEGEPADTTAMNLPEGMDADAVIDQYLEAIGGREKLSSVNDRTTVMKGNVQGFDIDMTVYQKAPSLLRQEIKSSGMDQIIIFNGDSGVMKMGDEERNIMGEELEKLKFDANLGLLLDPSSAGVSMKLTGVEKVENTKAYRIENKGGEITWNSFFDVESGLKILEVKDVQTPSGKFKQEIWFSDYRDVNGIKYPYKIRQKLGPQELTFEVTSIKLNQNLNNDLFIID
jgi:zinc protease